MSQNLCGAYTSNILINDTSDHLPMVCVLNSLISAKKEPTVIKSRDTRLRNLATLKRQLQDHDWTQDLADPSPSKNMGEIHNLLTTTINHCIPYKERTVNHKHIRKEAWLTASIKISIDRNKKLCAKMLKGECTKNKYTHYNNVLHKTIRHVKLKFYQDMCYEYRSQMKKLWGLINEIAGKTITNQASLNTSKLMR